MGLGLGLSSLQARRGGVSAQVPTNPLLLHLLHTHSES